MAESLGDGKLLVVQYPDWSLQQCACLSTNENSYGHGFPRLKHLANNHLKRTNVEAETMKIFGPNVIRAEEG